MRELPENLRGRIAAAAEVFAERGFDAARIEDVADATGIPKATLYYYFRGKEEILAYLLRVMLEEIRDRVKEASSSGGSAPERLRTVVGAQLGVMASSPAICQALIAELGRAGRIPETAAALNDAFYAPVRAILLEGAEDGTLRSTSDVDTAAAGVFGAVTIAGIHQINVSGGLDPERLASELVPLLMHGLEASQGTPRRRRA